MSRTKRNNLDPADLNHKILFYQESVDINEYGDQIVSFDLVPDVPANGLWCKKEQIKESNQIAIQAGASIQNQDCIFTFRASKVFYPTKSMVIKDYRENVWYTIAAVTELEEPAYYVRIVAIRKDNYTPPINL